ncbi:MAG: ParB N-terminal domain-containing protein, partial [Desulfobulbaceae bacterium]|nr:ParB N-terminal domain-containing protein [Desulfobulbaceae bacterium]
PADSEGVHEIIAGENRWRAAGLAKLAEVPCVIKSGGDVEARMDHVTDNALHRTLTLWQQANSIRRDQEEYGLTTEQIIAAHGLRNKTQLSKLMSVFKLSDEAQSFVKKGYVQDVNLIYDLKKLPDEQLSKLAKRVIDKGESFPAALKALQPKEPKEPKNKPGGGDGDGQQAGGGHVALKLKPAAARALAILLDIEGSDELNPATLAEQLQQRLDSMAEEGEGE